MRPFVPTSIRWLVALALTCFALPGNAQQSAAPRRTTTGISFTEPQSASDTTTNRADSKPFDLLGLESPIRKPFSPFGDAPDSFSGVGAPPLRYAPPSAAESKRLKEALDRKKNWAFATPEEMFGIAESDDALGTGLEEETATTSLERFLQRQENRRNVAISNQMKDDSLHDIFRTDKEAAEDQQKLTREEKPIFGFLADRSGQIPGGPLKIPGVSGFNESMANLGVAPTEPAGDSGFNLGEPAKLESSLVRNAIFKENMKRFKEDLEVGSFAFGSPSPAPNTLNPALARSPLSSGLGQPQPFSLGGSPVTPSSVGAIAPALPPTAFGAALPSLTPAQSFAPTPAPAPRMMPAPVFELPMRRF